MFRLPLPRTLRSGAAGAVLVSLLATSGSVAGPDASVARSLPTSAVLAARQTGLTADWSLDVARRHEPVSVSGHLTEEASRRLVLLQVLRNDRWVTRGRTSARAGHYRLEVPTTSFGRFTYRVIAPVTAAQRGAGLRTAASRAHVVRVARRAVRGPDGSSTNRAAQPDAPGKASDYSFIHTSAAR